MLKIGERIKACREAKGMKRPELAQLIDVDPNTLYRYESGSIGIKDVVKEKIAAALGVSVAYLLGSEKAESRVREGAFFLSETDPEPIVPPQLYLPVLNQEACAGNGFSWDSVETEVDEWMPWPVLATGGPTGPQKPYFVRVEGESMIGANIDDGSLILVNPNIEVRSGDIAYVKWNGRCSVKGIVFYNDGRIELRPANPNYRSTWIEKEDIECLEILGKVVRWLNMGVPKSIF